MACLFILYLKLNRCFYISDQIQNILLKQETEQAVNDVIYSSIGITILGHDCWAKAVVANELFGQKILPTEPLDAESDNSKLSWRMVMRLKYFPSL